MGRRSISTTKSGKYMNPTDQARKEARKRELKKNKKQRQMVRAAVLKGKDPAQIVLEMEKLDMMEYSVDIQPTLSEKVLKDKRKKLRETLDRILKLYEKENPEYWSEIRRMEADYEKKRQARIEYYESVRHAQAVTIEEIPLPNLDLPQMMDIDMNMNSADQKHVLTIQIPNAHLLPTHGILKKAHPVLNQVQKPLKMPPGCPPTIPAELSDDEEENGITGDIMGMDNDDILEDESEIRSRTIRFADGNDSDDEDDMDTRMTLQKSKNLTSVQTKLLQMSGQDIDNFMRETEVLLREKQAERSADPLAHQDEDAAKAPNLLQPPPVIAAVGNVASAVVNASPLVAPPTGVPAPLGLIPGGPRTGVPPGIPSAPPGVPPGAPPLMMRPPPRPGIPLPLGLRMPPVPPQGLPPRMPNMRMPPPPVSLRPPLRPPGIPLGMLPVGIVPRGPPPQNTPNVLSAGPQLINRPREDEKKSSATIEAKPQIRSLSADVTRFLPTALRVKREDRKKTSKAESKEISAPKAADVEKKPTKDDAYTQFMQEMEGLL